MERRRYRDDFVFHVELWEPPARPVELFAAAVDKEVAVVMARETQKQRPGVKVRLIGNPQRHGIRDVDTQELVFHLERWRADGNGFDRTLAVTKNVLVARVGYRTAIDRLPGHSPAAGGPRARQQPRWRRVMREAYYRDVRYPDRRELWLDQAAEENRLIVCRCLNCQRVVRYLASDLLPIWGPAHRAMLDAPFPCRCGERSAFKVECVLPEPGDYGLLDVRRPVSDKADLEEGEAW